MTFVDTILDIIFPVNCLNCGKAGSELCPACLVDCPEAERESEKWIFPSFDYRHPPIKKAVWLLKYKGKKRLAKMFAEIIYGRILEELADLSIMENFREVLLIPIPLAGKRKRERGFNQAELICKELVKIDQNVNFKMENTVLKRTKDGKHQARIQNRSERLKNVIGSFSTENEERIQKRNIILIDDVTTTGATLSEAKKVLKQAGARKIIAFTVAH
ncbi:MAG: ComF family protein [Candidatus Pacebacteria bacterium]|nr:ComF family protein [Candidatus Paceibacterota bacterium]